MKKKLIKKYKDELGLVRCHWCNRVLQISEVTREHILPQWCGGPNWSSNLFISCMGCQKAHRNPLDKENNPIRSQAIQVFKQYIRHNLPNYAMDKIPKEKRQKVIKTFNKKRRRIISCLRMFPENND